MTVRSYSTFGPVQWDGSIPVLETYDLSSPNSVRVNGKLRLRANPMSLRHSKTSSTYASGSMGGLHPTLTYDLAQLRQWGQLPAIIQSADDTAYGKLRGKLYKGNASLGVTIASYKQSSEMIRKNSNIISASAEDIMSLSSGRRLSRRAADRHLEVIFGWQPLLSDIHAAATSVIQMAATETWVRASSAKGYSYTDVSNRPGWYESTDIYAGVVRVTYAGKVRIENPNRWLAERAGLMNPAAVVWDLVPWSFLINMFSNVGSLVNSISDFAGLTFEDFSRTETHPGTARVYSYSQTYPGTGAQGGQSHTRYKERILTAPVPPRSLTFRIPEANWSNTAMAASLMVQQAAKPIALLSRFMRRS